MRPIRTHLAFIALTAIALAAPARVARATEADLATFDAVWKIVKRDFYDDSLHGLDWDAVRETYRPLARAATDAKEFRSVLLEMLGTLEASHTTILDREVHRGMIAELNNRRTSTFGILLEESQTDRWFVRALYEGGPGDKAGLRVGDRITAIDGVAIESSPRLLDAGYDPALPGPGLGFVATTGGAARIEYQTHPDAETRQTVEVVPVEMNGVDAAKNSVRVVERDGKKIGTLHLWFCQRGAAQVLEDAVNGPLKDCDALVLDVRGRGGYADVVDSLVAVFTGKRPLMDRLSGKRAKATKWTKPLVVLIDGRSRSAKEIFAWRVKSQRLGTLVGERTEGAVLGAIFHELPDGSWLELAGMEVPTSGGSLEGKGVAPHVEVDFVVPYARGKDPIFAKGVEVAARAAQKRSEPKRLVGPF